MTARSTSAGRPAGAGASERAAARCAARIREIFEDDLQAPPGVLHVTAVWQDAGGRLFTLRIGASTPRSATDAFVLGVARARCDAVVTTGRILRDEPEVLHRLPDDLAAWRRQRLGRREPPLTVVLTARHDVDLAHPLLARRALVVTSRDAAPRLVARVREAGRGDGIEVVGRTAPSLRDLLSFLREERGLADVCVEAGPATTAALYTEPPCVDELMLSVYLGSALPRGVRGGAFLGPGVLERVFPEPESLCRRFRRDEPESGPWLFCRHRRLSS